MFKCSQCQQSGHRQNRVVVERKMVTHVPGNVGPHGGVGSQIVREVVICDLCAGKVVAAPIERAAPIEEKPAEKFAASVGEHIGEILPQKPNGAYLSFDDLAKIANE